MAPRQHGEYPAGKPISKQFMSIWRSDPLRGHIYCTVPYSMQSGDNAVNHEHANQDGEDVLVVDDDRYLCDLIVDVLEADGLVARTAANGAEALQQVRERKPRLILLDLMMPVMNGWEVAAALQANPEWSDIPVVLITADYDVERKRQQTGAKAVITKPFDID